MNFHIGSSIYETTYKKRNKMEKFRNLIEGQKTYTVRKVKDGMRGSSEIEITGTLEELKKKFRNSFEVGKSWQHERGNKKVNMNPKSIKAFMNALNIALDNADNGEYAELV